MANEEVLGPRKTMFVLVIVVGCFAVLWPRILSPLILGHTQEQLKPNKFDREAGCCDVIFEPHMAVLELINEVCSSVISKDGTLSPHGAAECRKFVNETCGVDIVAFLKRTENVGKTTKMLLETMKSSNSSCLKEHFGVPVWSVSTHTALNTWTLQDTLKQERSPIRGAAPHPALRERGRAIPAGVPTPPSRGPAPLPPHVRVRSSPLSVYFELDIKPPPIPGMRPPLGSPGGPVPAPKSSMGFVMPIYTICIIVFFVYTLSKILFKRTATVPYDSVSPDPQFRRRVFRDDSRSSPDKLGDIELEALRARLAETERAMQRIVGQLAQRDAEVQDNHARPYTNGTILHNSGPVHIVASEYREASKEKSPETQKQREPSSEPKESTPEPKESTTESNKEVLQKLENNSEEEELSVKTKVDTELIKLTENIVDKAVDSVKKATEEFLENAKVNNVSAAPEEKQEKLSTPELLEEALKEDSPVKNLEEEEEVEEEEVEEEEEEEAEDDVEPENASVKVVGMELTAHAADGSAWPQSTLAQAPPPPPAAARPTHEADEVKSIFLETEIPQQSRVLVADFAEKTADRTPPTRHSPLVVSGKMTLSLIQDAPRDTPERDPESTLDDFTTASAVTQPAVEKEEMSDEEVEEEEIEIEEEVEEEEEEEEAPKAVPKKE
ncbi:probable RNA-binding protein CG14230 isoform X3 [Galleria mellonella]|uniref:Probable RNA-binding protein CG14230 isoform X3 n=1 Tax=Galleria mellonella TaxID=7137 RepID=A0A6J3BYX6_GALME|nr:probable RNA-binding protein CG14230 isoform X3 [Galleria mellonella]